MTAEVAFDYTSVVATPEEIDYDKAKRAYYNISFDPEKRGLAAQKGWAEVFNNHAVDVVKKHITNPEHYPTALTQLAELKEKAKGKYMAYLSAKSLTASPMITGPARFPAERNRKRMETEQRRYNDFLACINTGVKYILRTARDAGKEPVQGETEVIVKYPDGTYIQNNKAAERVQIIFPGKPEVEIISALKGRAFRYSPTNCAWQRQNTPQAIVVAKQLIDQFKN